MQGTYEITVERPDGKVEAVRLKCVSESAVRSVMAAMYPDARIVSLKRVFGHRISAE